jgi:anhydro-N-acetylmuramic acid kinase
LNINDSLATYVEHVAIQIKDAVVNLKLVKSDNDSESKLVVTGGGAFNTYLVSRIEFYLSEHGITVDVPLKGIVEYKEAIIMALLGVLRWREEDTVLSSVTGSSRNSIGGALWMGAH